MGVARTHRISLSVWGPACPMLLRFSLGRPLCLPHEVVVFQRCLAVVFLDGQRRGLLAFRTVSVHFVDLTTWAAEAVRV